MNTEYNAYWPKQKYYRGFTCTNSVKYYLALIDLTVTVYNINTELYATRNIIQTGLRISIYVSSNTDISVTPDIWSKNEI